MSLIDRLTEGLRGESDRLKAQEWIGRTTRPLGFLPSLIANYEKNTVNISLIRLRTPQNVFVLSEEMATKLWGTPELERYLETTCALLRSE